MHQPGRIVVKATTAGTIAYPDKALCLLEVIVHASAGAATLTIGTQDAVTVVNGASPMHLVFPEDMATPAGLGAGGVVGVNTDTVVAIFKVKP